uniref:Uncharacterized protein n=1 Tax=Rhizophora mucronata TaxID=61149 RepID=A0A2P2MUB2_RHIMU
MLTPTNRIKDALSCSKTYFTVVPFNEAIRSETHVLEITRRATESNCAPCLSSTVGISIFDIATTLNGNALGIFRSCGTIGNGTL